MAGYNNWHTAVFAAAIVSLSAGCDSGSSSADGTLSDPARSDAGSASGEISAPSQRNTSADAETERPVVSDSLAYAEVDEQLVYGYFAFPADMVDPPPGLILFHERWGLDDGTRLLADQIAGQGFVVLAIDLYNGKTATDAASARPLMVEVIENPELANENIRQARQFLIDSAEAPRIGVLGWSFGGGWALNAALLMPEELDAVVIYYGQVTDNEERLALLNAPLLGLFGDNDRGVTADTVRRFEQALENLGKDYEIEVYPGAGHAFADPTAPNYNPKAAGQAWAKVQEFLGTHLSLDAE